MKSKDIAKIAAYVLFYIFLFKVGLVIAFAIFPPLGFITLCLIIKKVVRAIKTDRKIEKIQEELDRIEPGLDASNAYLEEQRQAAEVQQARKSGKIVDLFKEQD